MQKIKAILVAYSSFFYLYVLFLLVVGVLLISFSKEESFLWVNAHYHTKADLFFRGVTGLGDGLFFALITLVLALYRYRLALLGLIIFITTSVVAQGLKRTLFDNVLRPIGIYGKESGLHLVEGVDLNAFNSFPSGHTTTAFALAVFLMLAFRLKKNGWLLAMAAILVGYSRVYLVQHFLVDVYFGSVIGVIISLVLYAWLDEPLTAKFGEKGLLSK